MIMPTIHMNGTGTKMLLEGYTEAYLKLGEAIEAIQKIEFNPRDYYPQGPSAWEAASNEMKKRVMDIHGVRDEIMEIAQYISDIEMEQVRRKNS